MFSICCPNTKIILSSELYKGNDEYWRLVMQMARRTTVARATRTLVIMGRNEKETLHVSQYIYPIMQAADIKILGADIPHAGIDQRKVHVLAMELFKDMKLGEIVPLHHHLIPSLVEPPKMTGSEDKEEIVAAMKMSKSKPGSAIPILSTPDEVKAIMKSAWCPEGVVENNPVLEMCKYLVMPSSGKLKVERPAKYGGDAEFTSYKELEKTFVEKKLHPVDLKSAVASSIIRLMEPITKSLGGEREKIEKLIAQ